MVAQELSIIMMAVMLGSKKKLGLQLLGQKLVQ